MSGKISKVFKWGASAVRVAKAKAVAGGRLRVASGKPLYLGKGARVRLGKGATCTMGAGVYLSPGCAIDVADDAHLVIEDGVYMNEACRVTVVDDVRIGTNTLFGPNVQVYDHDHKFDRWGALGAAQQAQAYWEELLALCQRRRYPWVFYRGSFSCVGELGGHSRPSRRGGALRWRARTVD